MKIYAVGIGPGDMDHLTPKAKDIILDSDVIVGYTTYIELISHLIKDKEVINTGMKGEIARCEMAFLEAKKGKKVAVVSSGDAGIYGMASLLFEMREKFLDIEVEVVPGITAANAAASILGSPLSNDFAVISLSDLLTPWEVIEKRLKAVSLADMVVCLYNPESHKRSDYLEKASTISLKYKSEDTCCGYVRNALRDECDYKLCTLKELLHAKVDMFTTVIIGNSKTKIIDGKLVTLRGYEI